MASSTEIDRGALLSPSDLGWKMMVGKPSTTAALQLTMNLSVWPELWPRSVEPVVFLFRPVGNMFHPAGGTPPHLSAQIRFWEAQPEASRPWWYWKVWVPGEAETLMICEAPALRYPGAIDLGTQLSIFDTNYWLNRDAGR